MVARRSMLLVLTAVFASMGASYHTTNFTVEAPTAEIAQSVGQYAEHYRREKAKLWLGQEMPAWSQRCPLIVTITNRGSGGATSFNYRSDGSYDQHMEIQGTLDRLLASVLPHEITHTVFAYYFRQPCPRWSDEGGAVLSEDDIERERHEVLVRQILNGGRGIPLRRLFQMTEYPSDVMSLYAQGYSVVNFLVGQSNRQTFLRFVAEGMQNNQNNWDRAVQTYYHLNSVKELEEAWLAELRRTKNQPPQGQVASADRPAEVNPSTRVVVRQTAPPVQPLLDNPQPTFRGQAPNDENEGGLRPDGRPTFLPDYRPGSRVVTPTGHPGDSAEPMRWQTQPARQSNGQAPSVTLGPPVSGLQPSAQLGQPMPAPMLPPGYPRD
jgi:hypothetical protein